MRWSLWRRNASRVALEASTPDLPLMPRSPSRPQCCATRRTTDSERWMLRLSPVAGFLQAVGDGFVFEPPLADEGFAMLFDWTYKLDKAALQTISHRVLAAA